MPTVSPAERHHPTPSLSSHLSRLLVSLLGALLATGASAIPPDLSLAQLRQDLWTTSEGLPQSSVHRLLQSERGFLWLGTQEGLARFDGVDFEIFDRQTYPELGSNIFSSLAEDAEGAIWAGSEDGVLRIRGDRRTLFKTAEGLASSQIGALAITDDGTLWVGSNRGLDRFVDGRFEAVAPTPELAEALAHGVDALSTDLAGRLWAGTNGAGVVGISPTSPTDSPVHLMPRRGLSSHRINALAPATGGGLWIGTGAGLDHLRADGTLETIPIEGLGRRPVYAVLEDRHGSLWVGSNGQGVFRRVGDRVERWSSPAAPMLIRHLFEDASGDVWVGSSGGSGLWRLGVGALSTLDQSQGLSHDRVYAVFEDSAGNRWFGSFGGGLDRLDPKGDWTNYGPEDGLASNLIWSLAEDRHGTLWIGTYGSGVQRLVGGRLTPPLTTADGLSNDFIRAIVEDRQGAIWIGTRGGLHRWSDGVLEHFGASDGLPSSSILSFLETRDGNLWIGTTAGLARRAGEGFEALGPDDLPRREPIYALHETDDGSLWLGTQGSGLLRFREGRFDVLDTSAGLFDPLVYSILEDHQGHFWLSCNRGLQRIDRQQLDAVAEGRLARVTPQVFGSLDGMKHAEANGGSQPVGWRRHDGSLMFATIGGAVVVHPDRLRRPDLPKPSLEALGLDHLRHRLEPNEPPWHIPSETRRLTFHFTAASFARAERLHFRHRLVGFDERWSPGGTERSVSYTGLSPGRYRFEVVVGDPGGPWTTSAAHLELVVQAAWWRTHWALVSYLVVLAIGTGLVLRWQQRRVARERAINAELRAVDRTKSALLANTSHELRTPLYGMIGLAEAQLAKSDGLDLATREGMRQIVASGQRLGELVDNLLTLGGVDQPHSSVQLVAIDIEHLVRAVLVRLRGSAEDKGLSLSYRVAAGLVVTTDRDLLIQALLHLVGNALKFTTQGSIQIEAEAQDGRLSLVVEDTGVGIAPEVMERLFEPFEQADSTTERKFGGVGLGLAVTRRRIEQLGGTIEVDSGPGRGTRVEVILPKASVRQARSRFASGRRIVAGHEPNSDKDPSSPPPRPPRVLVVDDESINRLLLHSQLEQAGFAVTEVASGPEALELFEAPNASLPFDLVVLDIMMPEMSGYEVCRRLREHFPERRLPILFLSARDRVQDILEGFEAGGDDYLVKPAHAHELTRRLRALLEPESTPEG